MVYQIHRALVLTGVVKNQPDVDTALLGGRQVPSRHVIREILAGQHNTTLGGVDKFQRLGVNVRLARRANVNHQGRVVVEDERLVLVPHGRAHAAVHEDGVGELPQPTPSRGIPPTDHAINFPAA